MPNRVLTERSTELYSTGMIGLRCGLFVWFTSNATFTKSKKKKTNGFIALNWIFQAMNDVEVNFVAAFLGAAIGTVLKYV